MIWMSRNLQKFPTQVFFWISLQSGQNRAGWIAVLRLLSRAIPKFSHAYSMEPGTHRGISWVFFCLSLHWGEPSPILGLSWSNSMGKTEQLHRNTQERNTIYALQLVKKNMPFLYHLLWYSEISSKKLKTVTILRVHRNLIFSPCSKHKAISLQLWEDGLLNRMPQSILNHNCFSGSKNKNTHFDNAAVTPLYDRNKPQQLMSCQEIMWKEPNKPINSNFVVKQFRMYPLKWSTQK